MTPTTWNPGDISSVTLSNANLTALSTAAGGVRSVFSATAGKYYFEITWVASSANGVVGIANASAILTNVAVNLANAAGYNNSGAIEVNTVVQGQNLGSISVGTVVGCAVDLGAQLIWFRPSTTNIWNGNASNNPASGTGGISIASVGGSIYALAAGTGSGPNVTANFGSTAFSGLVPSGFNAGLGVVPPADTFKILRSTAAGNRPSGSQAVYGAPYVNFADNQFGVVNASGQPVDLLLSNKNNFTFRNRIINGDMRWDQRNEGASVATAAAIYGLDRFKLGVANTFSKYTGQRVAGWGQFPYALKLTSASAYASIAADQYMVWQGVEADAVVDLQWGTAAAQSVTLSFRAQASVAGTYSGTIRSGDNNRSYGFTYAIASANTPQTFVVQIPGDTGGTTTNWPTSGNTIWGSIVFDLGSGSTFQAASAGSWLAGNYLAVTGSQKLVATNGATLSITGVQLEVGTIATPFEVLPPDVSLARCLRYYEKSYAQGTAVGTVLNNGAGQFWITGLASATNTVAVTAFFRVSKRTGPTITAYSPATANASGKVRDTYNNVDLAATLQNVGVNSFVIAATLGTAGVNYSTTWHWTADADF